MFSGGNNDVLCNCLLCITLSCSFVVCNQSFNPECRTDLVSSHILIFFLLFFGIHSYSFAVFRFLYFFDSVFSFYFHVQVNRQDK